MRPREEIEKDIEDAWTGDTTDLNRQIKLQLEVLPDIRELLHEIEAEQPL